MTCLAINVLFWKRGKDIIDISRLDFLEFIRTFVKYIGKRLAFFTKNCSALIMFSHLENS